MQFDLKDATKHSTLKGDYLWPNELTSFRHHDGNEIMLIPDGFLMPGQSNGGLYAMKYPSSSHSRYHPIRITAPKPGWFYHRAMHVTLPGGRAGIITARARKPILGEGSGQLVWITIPDNLENLSDQQEESSSYWDEFVIAEGPDVMFEVLNSSRADGSIDIISAHFFGKKLSIHSIRSIDKPPYLEIAQSSSIDTIGKPYGLTLANFDSSDPTAASSRPSHVLVSTHECSYDIMSTFSMAASALQGIFPRIRTGLSFRGVRDGEKLPVENGRNAEVVEKGGSLFAYRIPESINSTSSTEVRDFKDWKRQTLFRGFKVRGWGGIFSPGAPGFPYVIPSTHSSQPIIMLAGDCTGSAYIFTPSTNKQVDGGNDHSFSSPTSSLVPEYDLAFEVEVGATVRSFPCLNVDFWLKIMLHTLQVGSLAHQTNADSSIDIFVPGYELNKVDLSQRH
jgi:hypothetical protein